MVGSAIKCTLLFLGSPIRTLPFPKRSGTHGTNPRIKPGMKPGRSALAGALPSASVPVIVAHANGTRREKSFPMTMKGITTCLLTAALREASSLLKKSRTPVEEIPDPSEIIADEDRFSRILRQADRLCECGSIIFQLHYRRYSTHEISDETGIPQKTVYRRLQKILLDLQKHWDKYE